MRQPTPTAELLDLCEAIERFYRQRGRPCDIVAYSDDPRKAVGFSVSW